MEDDANFTKRMRELVEDGYIVFDKFGRWRVTKKGLACLLASADRAVKTNAQECTWPTDLSDELLAGERLDVRPLFQHDEIMLASWRNCLRLLEALPVWEQQLLMRL
jgi:hypothetical protein